MRRRSRKSLFATILVLPIASALLTACGGGSVFHLGHVETVEIQGARFPTTLENYTLWRCQSAQENLNKGTQFVVANQGNSTMPWRLTGMGRALYMSSDFMRRSNIISDDCSVQAAPYLISADVMRFGSPEMVGQYIDSENQLQGGTTPVGRSQCSEYGSSSNSRCSYVQESTIFRVYTDSNSEDIKVQESSGYRRPTMDELAKAAESIAAAQ